jgi:flagella basal body P-ring formation protein FlgA
VARTYRVNWRPLSKLDRITVARAGHVLERERIEALILDAAAKEGIAGEVDVDLDNRQTEISLPMDAGDSATLARFQLDTRTLRFAALLIAPANHPEARRYPVSGRLFPLVTVPAAARRMAPGETIGERDLTWIKVHADAVGPATLTGAEQVLGQSTKRMLAANRPIGTADIEPPLLVARNSIVTVVFRQPGMVLTAKAKASGNGAMGETIRVVNTTSNKPVDAVVIGPGTVAVGGWERPRLAYQGGN